MLIRTIAVIIALLISSTAAAEELDAELRAAVERFLERAECPGVSLGYVLADGTAAGVCAGKADLESGRALEPSHRLMAGSAGKMFFTAVILDLVASGDVALDEAISTWVADEPWFDALPNAEALTLRNLLNHTSGIPRYVMLPQFTGTVIDDPDRRFEPDEILSFVAGADAHFDAGAGWSYADTNFIVAALVIETVTGASCYDMIHERFLRPHALHDVVPTTSRDVQGFANGYVNPASNLMQLDEAPVIARGRYAFNPQFEWAGGGYATTPTDLARFCWLVQTGEIVSEAMLEEMRTTVAAQLGPESRYGLGLMQRPSTAGVVVGHAGYFPGYLTDVAFYTDHDIALAVQVNTTKMSQALNPTTIQKLLDECAAIVIRHRQRETS